MKKLLLIVFSVFAFYCTHAQKISGYVFSAQENTPVEFANVLILNLPDSSMVKGVITYMDGQYSADNINPGTYYIKASFVGFTDGGMQVEIAEGQDHVMVDTIYLSESVNELDAVVVTGDYVRAKELVDRTVYEILPQIEETSTNGYDVLKKIPSVQVDFNNNITLNGKSNFIIQVDGKRRDKEFLARILPGDIESVEIIHNPSGKYEGDIEGVINVILKPEARIGINGLFGMQLKPIGKTTLGAMGSLDYGREKFTVYLSGYSFIQNLNINTTDYRRISLPTVPTVDSILDIDGSGDFSISASSINAGVDFYPNDKNTLSINYNFRPFANDITIRNDGDISLDTTVVNIQENASDILTGSKESNISLFYRKKFKKPIQELTLEANYYFFNSQDDNDFYQLLYPSGGLTLLDSTFRNEITVNGRDYLSTRIDYVQPIGVSVRLEAGYQFYLQHMDYEYETTDTLSSNTYRYSETRHSAYTSFYWNLKKFSLQATLRVEDSKIDINEGEFSSHYTTLLPSLNLLYKFNTKHNLKFTYNRRINRPNIYRLNPFERLNNDLSISAGNPYLEPEYRDRLQLTYTMNIKKINFSPYIYHEFYSNQIDNLTSLKISNTTGELTVFSAPENILTGYEQGIGLNATVIAFNINGSVYRGHFNEYSDSLATIEARDYSSFRIQGAAYAPLFKKKVNVFAFVNYNGINRSAQTVTYSPLLYGVGLQQNIKNHSWGIIYLLPFSKTIQFTKTITETPNIYSDNTQLFDASWFIQVMYSYKFNKGRNIKKTEHKEKTESDTKGGGLGR